MDALPARSIGGRYRVLEQLGRGGMAIVYRVQDAGSGQELALKQLSAQAEGRRARDAVALFEREFHTLAQLAHPRVIAVYDYGIDAAGPFYTMELLDGGDLRALAPLDVPRACALMLDVCSSLALLHSRRLVHRDVGPRNIRCTRDGHAKLIDFGAMVPMGPCSHTVGTPAFVAPEVLHHSTLDGRTDLFSLGATLYYTLTGQPAFAARQLAELREAWSHEVLPPSRLVPAIPPALDALCASLLRIDPAQRPSSVFEVMQRLEAIAGVAHSEPACVSQAYLTTPVLTGRDAPLRSFRQRMRRALHGGGTSILVQSAPGIGRTRMLDACVLEAKTLGATVLRATAGADSPFAVAQQLFEQLLQVLPEAAMNAVAREEAALALLQPAADAHDGRPQLRPLGEGARDRAVIQASLAGWLERICETHALVIAVDDVQRADEASLAWLATLALEAGERRLLLLSTADGTALEHAPHAFSVLAHHSVTLDLGALTRPETLALLGSVFGHVPHLSLLSERLYSIALGSPRETMALAQHLADAGLIRYQDGRWTLPRDLDSHDLPASAADAFAARVLALPPLARKLAEAHALLGSHALRREDYAQIAPECPAPELDAAIFALLRSEVVQSDGELCRLSHRVLADTLVGLLSGAEASARHLALYELCARRGDRNPYLLVPHLLAAGRHEQALDLLSTSADLLDQEGVQTALRLDSQRIGDMLERALELAVTLRRPPREAHELRRRLCAMAVVCDDALYGRAAAAWLEQLELDSGLRDHRALGGELEPGVRLQQALTAAAARYAATPERERVYRVDEAIKHLVVYVMTSVVIAARSFDARLIESLPALLEPFAPLSPALFAAWQNVVALHEGVCLGRRLQALRRAIDVYERLGRAQGTELRYIETFRSAVAHGIGRIEAALGRDEAFTWAEVLDKDPLQRVTAIHTRRLTRLMQGDFEGAERFRKQAELLALRSSARQMFEEPWDLELAASVLARDLAGVRRVIDGIAPLAARYPGWLSMLRLAEGSFLLLRGDLDAARGAFEHAIELTSPERDGPGRAEVWASAMAGLVSALTELGQPVAAIEIGARALSLCAARGVDVSWHKIGVAVALAESRATRLPQAKARIEAVIAAQQQVGIRGLSLAASYEAAARIAIGARDAETATRWTGLALRERGGPQAAGAASHLVQLVEEARSAGLDFEIEPTDFEISVFGTTRMSASNPQTTRLFAELATCESAGARALRALELIGEVMHSCRGHLYLVAAGGELALAATLDAGPPDAEAIAFARGFFALQLDDGAMTTFATQATHMPSLPGAARYIDARGVEHGLVMLTCKHDGALVYVGLAVLATEARARIDPDAVVRCTGIATALLGFGDTRGASPEGSSRDSSRPDTGPVQDCIHGRAI